MSNFITAIYCSITKKLIKNKQAEWLNLGAQLEMLEDAPEPQNLKQKLISDARTAAANARVNYTGKVTHGQKSRSLSYKFSYSIYALIVVLAIGGFLLKSERVQNTKKTTRVISSVNSETKQASSSMRKSSQLILPEVPKVVVHKTRKHIAAVNGNKSSIKPHKIEVAKASEAKVTIEYTDISDESTTQSVSVPAEINEPVNLYHPKVDDILMVKQILEKDGLKSEIMARRGYSTREQL